MGKNKVVLDIERERAELAYRFVSEVTEKDKSIRSAYKSYAKKLPQMVLYNGLGQTIAFVFSKKASEAEINKKGENAYNYIYDQLSKYLEAREDILRHVSKPKEKDLMEWIVSIGSDDYRYVTEDLLNFLNWLRRFAEGMIEDEQE